MKKILISIGCIFLFLIFLGLLSGDDATSSSSGNDWQMEEIHKIANNVDDYITTYEAAGVILKTEKDTAQSTLKVLVNEDLWVNQTPSDSRNSIRYALQKKADEYGLSQIKITGNSSGVDLT